DLDRGRERAARGSVRGLDREGKLRRRTKRDGDSGADRGGQPCRAGGNLRAGADLLQRQVREAGDAVDRVGRQIATQRRAVRVGGDGQRHQGRRGGDGVPARVLDGGGGGEADLAHHGAGDGEGHL